ncbi:MAG TPA: hypothetical protein VGS19_24085 [Streptosporangiaceae bacterium]|nr:hypothetical protein [Streptosporangiaceae bacterium]
MDLRDEVEQTLRSWNAHEVNRGANPVIDFDCHPEHAQVEPAAGRLSAYRRIGELRQRAEESGNKTLTDRLSADHAYLAALMGERLPLTDYVRATQGCDAAGWPVDYVSERGEIARKSLDSLGVPWGPDLMKNLEQLCEPVNAADAPGLIREAACEHEPAVRSATGTDAAYELTIESANVDDYWSYWMDGAGQKVRLRLNMRDARFTQVEAHQFALHEVLGHGLQSASYSERAAHESVPWVRMTSVYALHQVLLEGLAQAMPLFITPDNEVLIARVRLVHYTQLVRAELHLAINSGASIDECAAHALSRAPWWKDAHIGDFLADRGVNPRLRSYLWAYPAGIDWFTSLADEADQGTIDRVLRAAYRDPLTPTDLATLWPAGPPIGGPGTGR